MKPLKTITILLLSMSFLLLASCSGDSTSSNDIDNEPNNPPPEEPSSDRDSAPDFSYTSIEGNQYTLSNYFGDVVYIFFYGANCPHCKKNGPVSEDNIYQEFKDNPNFVALGLDTWDKSVSANDNFKNVTGITYPLLLNAQQSLVDYYGNTASYDRSVVVDPDGNIAYMGTGRVNTDADEVKNVIEEELAKIEN